jgi:hypothetical protein
MMKRHILPAATAAIIGLALLSAAIPAPQPANAEGLTTLSLDNGIIRCSIQIENGIIRSERLDLLPGTPLWSEPPPPPAIGLDADFAIDVMFTDWSAPGKIDNADNPVLLTKKDFVIVSSEPRAEGGAQELTFTLAGVNHPIELRITYRIEPDAFYVKRNLAVRDTTSGRHFLRWLWSRNGTLVGATAVVKDGGFGQPAAMLMGRGGAFFGVEYPAAENHLGPAADELHTLRCGQEYGALIGTEWLASDWVVAALTPDAHIKQWFFSYLDRLRAAPLRPFSLYNTWYDLRSPEYPRWSADRVMSEKTCLAMARVLDEKMKTHGIKFDAFVLDDGWDVYDSDWEIRKEQWPNGFRPLADELERTGMHLGVWFGPTGGYSFHNRRLSWMKEHGYETVGDMLCVGGEKYGALLRRRVTDLVARDGAGYFKWDGIQFSCSEPDHGHPTDIYSRRAVMESVAGMCRAVREKRPDIFLNISSGTWLSPWWVRYANTIWMQGMDYGFADVPSISKRDGSITYRDFVLYDDFRIQDRWFPIANLMTHGIIKGKDFSVGVETEPLDKFTDDVLLYFARGVAMYELYISPDILSDGEWAAISKSMAWARDRFSILMNTEMVGGNPMKGEAYAWVHFKGSRGIVAARNPVIHPAALGVELTAAHGLDAGAASLVLERVYPTRWISPRLYRSGDRIDLALDGFETAVYELYPLEEASEPLLAGVAFDVVSEEERGRTIRYYDSSPEAVLLNPGVVLSAKHNGASIAAESLTFAAEPLVDPAILPAMLPGNKDKAAAVVDCYLQPNVSTAALAILLSPASDCAAKEKPVLAVELNGAPATATAEPQEGRSQWWTVPLPAGGCGATLRVTPGAGDRTWTGTAQVWLVANQRHLAHEISFELAKAPRPRVLPPLAWPAGETRRNVLIGEMKITTE